LKRPPHPAGGPVEIEHFVSLFGGFLHFFSLAAAGRLDFPLA
jgi:hypothetical protein